MPAHYIAVKQKKYKDNTNKKNPAIDPIHSKQSTQSHVFYIKRAMPECIEKTDNFAKN